MSEKRVDRSQGASYRVFLLTLGLCMLLFGWVTAVHLFGLALPAWPAWYTGFVLSGILLIFSLIVGTRELFRKMTYSTFQHGGRTMAGHDFRGSLYQRNCRPG